MSRILVTGGGGFIGHHLIKRLKAEGHYVRAADIKLPEYENSSADEFFVADLRLGEDACAAVTGMDEIYHLACEMGGIGFTLPHSFEQRLSNTLIDANVADRAHAEGVRKLFFASSACVYNETLQAREHADALREDDAYPAQPDLSYGWAKLACEQLLTDLALDSEVQVYIARFHNVYGELGSWDGGREKAPAALCRKIARAKLRGDDHITVWGDGWQERSFMYIDDCLEGILRLTASDHHEPINLGRDEQVSINELAWTIMQVAGSQCRIEHDLTKPQGVRSRNSDNSRLREVLNWTPEISLYDGLSKTYQWIEAQVSHQLAQEGSYESR